MTPIKSQQRAHTQRETIFMPDRYRPTRANLNEVGKIKNIDIQF